MGALVLHGPTTSTASTLAALDQFDALVGAKSTMFHCHFPAYYGTNPDGSDKWLSLPIAGLADPLWKRSQLALFTWGTWNLGTHAAWQVADVVAGKHDSYLTAQAKAVAAWGHPIFLRLDHEMNGTWSPWYTDGPSFVRLWRYVVAAFRANGAGNATWVWCPNQLTPPGSSASTAADKCAAYYPGDDVVDWTAYDAYNTGNPWVTFAQMSSGSGAASSWLGDTYGTIARIAPGKPMLLAEFGCVPGPAGGPTRAQWIADALAVIPQQYPLIRGVSYYHAGTSTLDGGDGSAAAYGQAIKATSYAAYGQFPAPPDLRTIRPLQSATTWGDVVADLAVAQSSMQALTTQLGTAQATAATLASQVSQGATVNAALSAQLSDLTNQVQQLSPLPAQLASAQAQLQQTQTERDLARQDAAQGRSHLSELTSWAATQAEAARQAEASAWQAGALPG